ncbi:TetR/AcrR family transcriptional regulator [Luteimonas abyssi]|uniref:TetR/AcrR family transcriptional regulator n=1 Tax=Luteimonas abyssi TaxID=1247514 RepID=UPI000737D6FB|nr:TetR/AcrR family transcriptional regulator [Luteimonas abyssi]
MPTAVATAKGVATRETIVAQAHAMAARGGLESLSIGELATAVGMSKSGVFAHFGSREDLLRTVLDTASERFFEHVMRPAFAQPRGLARLHALVDNWFVWLGENPNGCVVLGACIEYDGQPGPMRDHVVAWMTRWLDALERAVGLAVTSGELRADTDTRQLAFELISMMHGTHQTRALYRPADAMAMGRRALLDLLDARRAPSSS